MFSQTGKYLVVINNQDFQFTDLSLCYLILKKRIHFRLCQISMIVRAIKKNSK